MTFYGTIIENNTNDKLLPTIYIENDKYYVQCEKNNKIFFFNPIENYNYCIDNLIKLNYNEYDNIIKNINDNIIYIIRLKNSFGILCSRELLVDFILNNNFEKTSEPIEVIKKYIESQGRKDSVNSL